MYHYKAGNIMSSKKMFIAAFILPTLLLYCIFGIYPIFRGFGNSLYNWSGYTDQKTFIGLQNYIDILSDGIVLQALKNDLITLLWKEILIISIAMLFAVAIARLKLKQFEKGFFRILFFFPNVVSVVLIGLIWSFIFHPTIGTLNSGLKALGLDKLTHAWLGETQTVVPSIIGVAVWAGIGFFMLYFIAGIKSIPEELYEACVIDGGGEIRQFIHITLPMLREHLKFSILYILCTTLSYNYILVIVMSNGGPDSASEVMGSYIFHTAFSLYKAGYASALGVVLLVTGLLITGLFIRLWRRETIVE